MPLDNAALRKACSRAAPRRRRTAPLAVTYRIEEGEQLRVGAVRMEGNDHVEAAKLTPLLNTAAGPVALAAEPGRRPRRAADRAT